MKVIKRIAALWLAAMAVILTGCSVLSEESVKLQDIAFTVVSEEKQPAELRTIIEEKKSSPFQLTYNDGEYLYIVIGYGEQPEGGYSIAVNEMYLTEDNIYVSTTLLGPDSTDNRSAQTPSCPYIVLKMDYLDKPVVFE